MAFAGWLAFVMLIGAAKADASPEQAVLLRDAVQPLIDDMRSGGSPIKRIRVSGPWREVPDAD